MFFAGMPAAIPFWAALVIAVLSGLVGGGCSSPPSKILQIGVGQSPVKPYEDTFFVPHSLETVWAVLYQVLGDTGAMVIAAGEDNDLLAWCDRSGLFHPLIRDRARSLTPYVSLGFGSPQPSQFHGVVYACARLKAHRDGTILKLHAKQRDERPWILAHSNGDYERYIHRCLNVRLRQLTQSAQQPEHGSAEWRRDRPYVASETLTSKADPANAGTRQRAASYGSLYSLHFSSLPLPKAREIQTVGQHYVYPVPIHVFWEACLDVLCQYDAVAALDGAQHIIVVSHGMSLPVAKDSDASARYCNALIAILAQPRGDSGTDVYVAWLPPGTLIASAIEPPECSTVEQLERAVQAHPHRVTAAWVAGKLTGHISTQLYWRDWLPKLGARQPSRATGAR